LRHQLSASISSSFPHSARQIGIARRFRVRHGKNCVRESFGALRNADEMRTQRLSHHAFFALGHKLWRVAFSPDGQRIVSGSKGVLKVWNLKP
jgi:WD40 repeat protein